MRRRPLGGAVPCNLLIAWLRPPASQTAPLTSPLKEQVRFDEKSQTYLIAASVSHHVEYSTEMYVIWGGGFVMTREIFHIIFIQQLNI